MKKRIVVLLILLASLLAVHAAHPAGADAATIQPGNISPEGIQRLSDIPLDNVHILRLQEAAKSLGGNVSALQDNLSTYHNEQQQNQAVEAQSFADLKGTLDSFQRSIIAQIAGVQKSVDDLQATTKKPEVAYPAQISFPPYLIVLLGMNVFLLIVVILLIFWLREQYYVHRETHSEEHIHPAPVELVNYVKHQLEHDRKLPEMRIELAKKGWTTSIIEHAIHAAKEK